MSGSRKNMPLERERLQRGFSARRAVLLVLAAAVILAAGFSGRKLWLVYKWHGPVRLCDALPEEKDTQARVFNLDSDEAPSLLGYKSDRACPEAPRAFVEWYAFRIYLGEYFIDGLLQAKDVDRSFGIAGFSVWNARTLKPLLVSIEESYEISWAREGCDVRIATQDPGGNPSATSFRLHRDGPHAGEFELIVSTRDGRLEVFIRPLVPGYYSDLIGADPTREHGWFQYLCVTMMGEAVGELTLHLEDGKIERRPIPLSPDQPTRVYLEHMWGQMDRPSFRVQDRYCWEWGTWGLPRDRTALMFSQTQGLEGKIQGAVGVSFSGDLPLLISTTGEGDHLRVPYSRLLPKRGMFYPQEMSLWAFQESSGDHVQMKGFSRVHFFDWLSMDLWGRAASGDLVLDRSVESLWTVMDFYKGGQKEEKYPAPAKGLTRTCGEDGCVISWQPPDQKGVDLEYWVFGSASFDWTMDGRAVAVVRYPPDAGEGGTVEPDGSGEREAALTAFDPGGREDDLHVVVPVKLIHTMLHQRQISGRPRLAGREFPGESQAAPGPIVPLKQESVPVNGNPGRRVTYVIDPDSGIGRLVLEKSEGEAFREEAQVGPGFSSAYQLQSIDAAQWGDMLAIAWSERSRIMGTEDYCSWDVYLAIVEPGQGAYRVMPLSMSDTDSVNVSIEPGPDGLAVQWLECSESGCVQDGQSIPEEKVRLAAGPRP